MVKWLGLESEAEYDRLHSGARGLLKEVTHLADIPDVAPLETPWVRFRAMAGEKERRWRFEVAKNKYRSLPKTMNRIFEQTTTEYAFVRNVSWCGSNFVVSRCGQHELRVCYF